VQKPPLGGNYSYSFLLSFLSSLDFVSISKFASETIVDHIWQQVMLTSLSASMGARFLAS